MAIELPRFPNGNKRLMHLDSDYDLVLQTLAAAGENGVPNTILGPVIHPDLENPLRALQTTTSHLNTALSKRGSHLKVTAEKVIVYRLEEIE